MSEENNTSNLLDINVSASDDPNASSEGSESGNTESKQSDAKWWLAEGIPGPGEKPEWFDDKKYKYAVEQAQGTPGLRKLLGGFSGAPEKDYEVKISDDYKDKFTIDKESQMYKSFSEYARSVNMNNDAFNDLINLYAMNAVNGQDAVTKDYKAYIQAEKEKLGEKGDEIIKEVSGWITANLPTEFHEVAKQLGESAAGVKMLQYIAAKSRYSPVPQKDSAFDKVRTENELMDLMRDKRYGQDPVYTSNVDKAWQDYCGDGPSS